jgi:Ulp1 family protease
MVDSVGHITEKPLHLEEHKKKLILWPIFYSNHFILAVIKGDRTFDVFDSLRTYAHRPRWDAVELVARKLRKVGITVKPTFRECEQQKGGSNDCGLHAINNALVAIGIGNMKHTRATLAVQVRSW